MTKTPDRLGQLIAERYELQEVIGRGGQGIVYRASDRWMQRAVAVKVLGSRAVRNQHVVERLMREQEAMTALKGTAAVELFDVCRASAGELCLVMELLSGVDLDDYLYAIEQQKQRLALPRIVEIFDPIVDTLEQAHRAGILHRDLKPANVFLLHAGGVRLLDFGMARLKQSAPLTAAGTVMGSPSFMAPEAWKGVSDLMDQRADVYSLGVILFRVLSGELPFQGTSLQEKFLQTTTATRPSLRRLRPDLPRAADDWVLHALALDREERFGNVRAFWNAFQGAFRVTSGMRGRRASLWEVAKGALQRFVAPAPSGSEPLERIDEPSFMREALARSAYRISTLPDATIELRDDEVEDAGPAREPSAAPDAIRNPLPARPPTAPPKK